MLSCGVLQKHIPQAQMRFCGVIRSALYLLLVQRNGEIGVGPEVFYVQAEACTYVESKKSSSVLERQSQKIFRLSPKGVQSILFASQRSLCIQSLLQIGL